MSNETDLNKQTSKLCDILARIKSTKTADNLLDHINKLFKVKELLDDDEKYNDLFEDISMRIKHSQDYIEKIADQNICHLSNHSELPQKINEEKKLLSPLIKTEEGSEPQPVANVNYIPDYVEMFDKLAYCGINFGHKEAMLINNSLRNLSNKLGSGYVTFFGKILGSEKDYYIAQGVDVEPQVEPNYDNDMEKRKEDGINRDVFFVTNDLCENWVELPDVKPIQLKQSRLIKYTFSGNLDRKIYTTPEFLGQEKHLLRCQIARIYHGAKLVPSINHFTIEDQESPFKMLAPAEKPQKLTSVELTNLNFWIHYPPGILKNGRVSHIIDDLPEGEDAEVYRKKIMDEDPFDPRLRPVSKDKPLSTGYLHVLDYEFLCPWKLEQFYEDSIYVNPYVKMLDETQPDFDPLEQKENKMNYSIVAVKSLRWKGAVNVYLNGESHFFYFGEGMKTEDNFPYNKSSFRFNDFPVIPGEVEDKKDNEEPHVQKA